MNRETVAAFDFDGTVTYFDTLIPFLLYVAGPLRFLARMPPLVPTLATYAAGRLDRTAAKERVLARFLRGARLEDLRRRGERYAARVIPRLVRPASLRRLEWHKGQGHRCVLISASLDLYLEPWARATGFDDLVCSRLTVEDNVVTGTLAEGNCYGPEKIRRLRALLGDAPAFLYAYGDSGGDRELLAAADRAYYRRFPAPGEEEA